jgi:cell division protein FtsB
MNIWVLLYKFAWIVVVVACVIGVVCVFIPKAHSYRELQKRKVALEENNARMEARARQLEINQQRFRSDPDFVERIAREQGRAKPGETIFRFPVTNAVVTNKP